VTRENLLDHVSLRAPQMSRIFEVSVDAWQRRRDDQLLL